MQRECKLFFFGDSICFGQRISPHKIWVSRIAAALDTEFPELCFTVQNPSINGNTTRMALERMSYDVQAHRPDILVVQFGLNDCNYWESDGGHPRVSRDAFTANLHEIIDRGRIFGADPIVLGANHPTCKTGILPHTSTAYEQSNRQYNELIRKVAASKNVLLVDIEAAAHERVRAGEAYASFVTDDLLHLSDRGHDLYVETYYPVIRTAVTQWKERTQLPIVDVLPRAVAGLRGG